MMEHRQGGSAPLPTPCSCRHRAAAKARTACAVVFTVCGVEAGF